MTKTDKFVTALIGGQSVTIKQAVKRFGFASSNSLTGTVSRLRDEGFKIESAYDANSRGRKTFKYYMAA